MKVLVVDNKEILHKGEYEAEAVVILFDCGYRVVSKERGVEDICVDLEKLLAKTDVLPQHLKAVKAWFEKHKGSEG